MKSFFYEFMLKFFLPNERFHLHKIIIIFSNKILRFFFLSAEFIKNQDNT